MSILLYVSLSHRLTMAIASIDVTQVTAKVVIPDQGFETFVAKVQKVKTRKGKDYYISRITVPKEIINNIDVDSEDFLFLKAKKAEWFHMLNWDNMESTWNMLPNEIKWKVIKDGVFKQSQFLAEEMRKKSIDNSTTDTSGTLELLEHSMVDMTGAT